MGLIAVCSACIRQYANGAHFVLRRTGGEPGQTSREVVWRKGKARLYRYEPGVEERCRVPVLLVYALILRPYIMYLVPGNSFVEYLFDEGFDVYLLAWGVPDGEDGDLSFEDYVLGYMPEAVERVLEPSGAGGRRCSGTVRAGP